MKKSRHDVESELKSLIPKSPSPEIAERIAGQLAETGPVATSRSILRWAAPALAVAAGIALAVVWWPSQGDVTVSSQPVESRARTTIQEMWTPNIFVVSAVFD